MLVPVLMDTNSVLYVLRSSVDETMSFDIKKVPDEYYADLAENGLISAADCYDPVVYAYNL